MTAQQPVIRLVYDIPQAAELLGLSELTVRRAITSGELPAVRINGRGHGLIRIKHDALMEWLNRTPVVAR